MAHFSHIYQWEQGLTHFWRMLIDHRRYSTSVNTVEMNVCVTKVYLTLDKWMRFDLYQGTQFNILQYSSVVNETVQLKSEFCDCTKIPDPTGQARKPVALELGLFITFEGKEVTLVLYDCCQAS